MFSFENNKVPFVSWINEINKKASLKFKWHSESKF